MMYCNFKILIEKGLTNDDYINLIKISQREFVLLENVDFTKFEEMGLVTYLKGKSGPENVRLTASGKALMQDINTPGMNEEIGELTESLMELYSSYNYDAGNPIDIKDKLVWFCTETNFSVGAVKTVVEEYLSRRSDYTMKLDNLIHKAQNVFTVHKNLKDSKLFELFQKKYNLPLTYFLNPIGNTKKEVWLFDCSKLKIPSKLGPEFYWTGSREGDEEALTRLKKEFRKILKN